MVSAAVQKCRFFATHFSKLVLKGIDGKTAFRVVNIVANRGIQDILNFRK